jgi:hypothetical protein
MPRLSPPAAGGQPPNIAPQSVVSLPSPTLWRGRVAGSAADSITTSSRRITLPGARRLPERTLIGVTNGQHFRNRRTGFVM